MSDILAKYKDKNRIKYKLNQKKQIVTESLVGNLPRRVHPVNRLQAPE
jgi:hypothetical protein